MGGLLSVKELTHSCLFVVSMRGMRVCVHVWMHECPLSHTLEEIFLVYDLRHSIPAS